MSKHPRFITKFGEQLVNAPVLGVFLDLDSTTVPEKGWLQCDQFHFGDNEVNKYRGWTNYIDPAKKLDSKVIYINNFEKLDGERYTIAGTLRYLYVWNGSEFEALNATPFNTRLMDRWQSAVINDKIYFVNGSDPIQEYDGTTLQPLHEELPIDFMGSGYTLTYKGFWNANANTPAIVSSTGTQGDYYQVSVSGTTTIDGFSAWQVGDWILYDGAVWKHFAYTINGLPTTAKYILNVVNHLMVANTTEDSTECYQRIRWSDLSNQYIWQSTASTEANYIDVGEGGDDVRGIGNLAQYKTAVYKSNNIYTFTYVGLPVIFTVDRIVPDEGLRQPYSLVSCEGSNYFVGYRDIYAFTGTSLKPLGLNKVRDWYFKTANKIAETDCFATIHPIFPEVWFVYKEINAPTVVVDPDLENQDKPVPLTDTQFTSCLVYNWEMDVWSTRNYFPQSALGLAISTASREMGDITTPGTAAVGTWLDKIGAGTPLILGGDENGMIYQHGFALDAAGVVLTGTLETGDKFCGSHSRPKYFNRLSLGLTQMTPDTVFAQVGVRQGFNDTVAYQQGMNIAEHPHYDFRVTSNMARFMLEGDGDLKLMSYSYFWQFAGDSII